VTLGGWIGIALLVGLAPAGIVTAAKGRWTLVLSALLLLFPLLWYGALAPASPASWWARRFYDEVQLERARRYQAKWSRRFAE
jgi:hypothetical protein